MKRKTALWLSIFIIVVVLTLSQKTKRLFPPFYKLGDVVSTVEALDSFDRSVHLSDAKDPLHFVHTGDKSAPAVLFIHGSPGSWEAWAEYLHDPELRDHAFMVAVDRPGYGGSNNGLSGRNLKEQSDMIMAAMKAAFPDQKKWLVVGHSYGGPVALKIAADYPDQIEALKLLAPAISPDLVRVRFYNRIADLPIIRGLLPTPLHHSNEEMFLLPQELVKMRPQLVEIEKSVMVIQGEKDGIVAPGNAAFAKEELTRSIVEVTMLPERGHFLPWEEYDLIKNAVLEKIKR